jgi:hypothetical protein
LHEFFAGAMDLDARGNGGDIENTGDFFVAKIVFPTEQQGSAVERGQTLKGGDYTGEFVTAFDFALRVWGLIGDGDFF